MSESKRFLIMMITILIAMGGSVFVYRKVFRKKQMYYTIYSADINAAQKDSNVVIEIDPYLSVYGEDGKLLKEDAVAADKFIPKDSVTTLSVMLKDSVWHDVSEKAIVFLDEMDAGAGSMVRKSLTAKEWLGNYSAHPSSTKLTKAMMMFTVKDMRADSAQVSFTLSTGKTISAKAPVSVK
jgi:hypothetical protein